MTKVQLSFPLSAPLSERQIAGIADLYRIDGILRVNPDPAGQNLQIEYDATRFSPEDVEAALARAGFPLAKSSV